MTAADIFLMGCGVGIIGYAVFNILRAIMKNFNERENVTWLTADETTEYLGLPSKETLYQMTRNGEIPFYRLGKRRLRFRRLEIDQLLENGKGVTYSSVANTTQHATSTDKRTIEDDIYEADIGGAMSNDNKNNKLGRKSGYKGATYSEAEVKEELERLIKMKDNGILRDPPVANDYSADLAALHNAIQNGRNKNEI